MARSRPRESESPEALETFIGELRASLDALGMLESSALPMGVWRHEPASAFQLWHLERLVRRVGQGRLSAMGVPAELISKLGVCCRHAPRLSQGALQDLIEVLGVLPWRCWPAQGLRASSGSVALPY